VSQAFQENKYRLNGTHFAEVCKETLPCKEEDDDCWCEWLCQRFRQTAQDISDKSAGALGTTGSGDLIKRQQELMARMQHHMSEAEMCRADRETILKFSKQLAELKEDMDRKFRGVQEAEYALNAARWKVVALEELLKNESTALTWALEELESAEEAYGDAAAALKALQADEESLRQHLGNTSGSLRDARLELENIKSSERAATTIKSAVTTVIAQMRFHLESEVQDPIRKLGITEHFDPGEYNFPEDVASLDAADEVQKAVAGLYGHCAGEAQQAFADVAGEVDLGPLCTINGKDGASLSAEDSMQGIIQAIMDRSQHIKKELLELQSWLDPFKEQNVTKEDVDEFIEKGEPDGLRELFGAYRNTKFYNYLEGWMIGGPLLKLVEKLGATVEGLERKIVQFEEELESIESEAADAKAKRTEAEEKLAEAVEHQKKLGRNHTKQEKVLEQLSADGDTLAAGLKDLEDLVREAKKKYKAAIDKLVESHAAATALLQTLRNSFSSFWEGQNRVDKDRVASLEAALLEAKKHHRDVELQLQSRLSHQSHRSISRHTHMP